VLHTVVSLNGWLYLWHHSSTKGEKEMVKKKVARKAPQKQCPKCGKKVHARKSVCDCGHQFTTTPKKKAAPAKKKAAQPSTLVDALKSERSNLQQRITKIDDLLDTYS